MKNKLYKNSFIRSIRWYKTILISYNVVCINLFSIKINDKNFKNADIKYRILQNEDIPNLLKFHDECCVSWNYLFDKNELKERIKNRHKCFIALDGDDICAMYWLGIDNIYSPDLKCTFFFDKDIVVSYNAFVSNEYRGRNIFPDLRKFAFDYMWAQQYRYAFGYSLKTNTPVNESNKKFNVNYVGTIKYGFLLGFYYLKPCIDNDFNINVVKNVSAYYVWKKFLERI